MFLSVVIPLGPHHAAGTRKNADILERCLHSLSLSPTDDAEVIVEEDTRGQGAAAMRNRGLERARGDYVWFVDADDEVSPKALHTLAAARDLLGDADLVKMGPMARRAEDFCHILDHRHVEPSALLVPRSSCLDHTTYLFRRLFLLREELRYPNGMRLLEDSLFVLRAIEHARSVALFPRLRLYLLHPRRKGGWDAAESHAHVDDMLRFFPALRRHADGCPPTSAARGLYDRYLYVYLRVLAVKGSPWGEVARFRQGAAVSGTFFYGRPPNALARALRHAPLHRALRAACRVARWAMRLVHSPQKAHDNP